LIFDNEYPYLITNGACSKKYLLEFNKKLSQVRAENRRILKRKVLPILTYEYSSCYAKDFIIRKMNTYAHTGYNAAALLQALRCNHRPAIETAHWKIQRNKYFFFRTIALTEKNSPQYVRENLSFYKTNCVDKNYEQNRRADYPHLYSPFYGIKAYAGQLLSEAMALFISSSKKAYRRLKRFFIF